MAELTTIARPYAKAAFLFAKEQNALAQWESMLATAAAVMAEPSVRQALDNPALGASRKAALLAEVCGDAIDSSAITLTSLRRTSALACFPLLVVCSISYSPRKASSRMWSWCPHSPWKMPMCQAWWPR